MKATSGKDYKYIANNDVEMKGAKGKSNDKNVSWKFIKEAGWQSRGYFSTSKNSEKLASSWQLINFHH